MTKKTNINVLTKTDNVRLYVIEHSLHIETLMAEAIGSLLGIDYKKSKSFGFGSSSLSFNQKVLIVQDIKGIESEMAKKLTCLMNIRNKFAHVQEVDSFENLFLIANNGAQIKGQLEGWYTLEDKNEGDETYKFLFFKLANDIAKLLFILQTEERIKKKVLEIEKDFIKSNLESYREVVSENEKHEEIDKKVFDKTMEKLPHLSAYRKVIEE